MEITNISLVSKNIREMFLAHLQNNVLFVDFKLPLILEKKHLEKRQIFIWEVNIIMRHGIIFVYILMFLPGLSFSQNSSRASVNGFIKDKNSGKILHTAKVILKGTNIRPYANKSGYYSINDIKPGSYTLVYSYIGYKRRQLSLKLKPDQQVRLDVNLVSEPLQLKELTVNSE